MAIASNHIQILSPDLPVVESNAHGGMLTFRVERATDRTTVVLSMMDPTYLRRLAQTIEGLADQMDDTSVCTCQEVGA